MSIVVLHSRCCSCWRCAGISQWRHLDTFETTSRHHRLVAVQRLSL